MDAAHPLRVCAVCDVNYTFGGVLKILNFLGDLVIMDVWLNYRFLCKDLKSSNWSNHFWMDVSGLLGTVSDISVEKSQKIGVLSWKNPVDLPVMASQPDPPPLT